jgi:hypothetical protein
MRTLHSVTWYVHCLFCICYQPSIQIAGIVFGIFILLAALNLPCILVTKCESINSLSIHLHASLLLGVLQYATFTSQNTEARATV